MTDKSRKKKALRKQIIKDLKSSGVHAINGKSISCTDNGSLKIKYEDVFGFFPTLSNNNTSKVPVKGYVYFIGNTEYNYVKIGYSRSPESRIKELQTACPFCLRVIHVVEGSLDKEKSYHRKYRGLKTYGEWFSISGHLKEYLSPHLDG